MATKSFELNTEPHVANVGGTRLLFIPEVVGAEFMSAYGRLREVQSRLSPKRAKASSTKHADNTEVSTEDLIALSDEMRSFLRSFMLPESHATFDGMKLPDRILVQLMEWVAELYGGGSGNPDAGTGTSTG